MYLLVCGPLAQPTQDQCVAILAQAIGLLSLARSTAPRMAPKVRPLTSYFDSAGLAEAFAPLASLKDPGFAWNGQSYTHHTRGPTADRASLKAHEAPLAIMLRFAATGFPSHKDLRRALTLVDVQHSIFRGPESKEEEAIRASDQWRILCKHIYELAKGGYGEGPLKELVAMIRLTPKQPSEEGAKAAPTAASSTCDSLEDILADPTLNTLDVELDGCVDEAPVNDDSDDGDDDDASSVEFVSAVCRHWGNVVPAIHIVHLRLCVVVFVCLFVCVCVCACLFVFLMFECLCLFVFVCVCLCVCWFVCVC